MKIGLINPNKYIKESSVHLGLGYIAAYALKYKNHLDFRVLDTGVAKDKEIKNYLDTKFDLIGITASSQVFLEAVELASLIKEKFPKTPVCIGGPHASIIKQDILVNYPFDFAVKGEGEKTFLELIDYVENNKSLNGIKGLIYKNNGEIRENLSRELLNNISEIPFPAYYLFPMEKYPNHRIITSRGCPYDCVFCNSKTIWTRKWRKRTAEDIVSEIEFLITNYRRKTFALNDDCFNIDLERIHTICSLLIEKKLNIIWGGSIRIDCLDPETAQMMKKAGCYNLNIGIESGNEQVMSNIKKKLNRKQIMDGVNILRNAGIDVIGQFMIGNPGDTIESIKESIQFAQNLNLTGAEFYAALPYPETELYNYAKKNGRFLTDKDCTQYFDVEPRIIFETPEFSYDERLKAMELVSDAGFFTLESKDRKNILFSAGKFTAQKIQTALGPTLGNKVFVLLRKIYRFFNNFIR